MAGDFELYPLAMEDVVNIPQRAKVEDFESNYFMVTPLIHMQAQPGYEQVSLFFGKDFVISFHERESAFLDLVRERIRKGQGRKIHLGGSDYLAYALLDTAIDHYFPALDHYSDQLDVLEQQIADKSERSHSAQIHTIKGELLAIRRSIWPLREALSSLMRDDSTLVQDVTRLYLRDAYDHIVQIIELIESSREVAMGLMDLYLSMVSNRMNEVMKLLTIIATIFIPLSFIAGLYGMNFDPEISPLNMPELSWYWGYPFALTLMALMTAAMVLFFWRRGWLCRDRDKPTPGGGGE
ncbi:MAG: magnesium/cobalt transporter CorA [Candidatus Alcyoniella australis]|nr:magnesium/cobalt transporter CorA [Candidatus Alcyoniella australis]